MQINETVIPFDFIAGLSPFNVRQVDPSDDVSSLKATIWAVGLINPLVVHRGDDNRFLVLAGGRRWRALSEIQTEEPGAFWNIPAKIVEDATDAEKIALSTMENTQTLAMHPVRQYEAFAAIAHALPSPEAAITVIAKEFGLTRQQVRQRMALGDLSPKIRKAWLDGDLDAEAAKAYAASADIAAQEAYFDAHEDDYHQGHPHYIRKALLADWRNPTDSAVRFVGEEAYRAAGGEVKESLFDEERFFNGALIDKLAEDQLRAEGERIRQAEGWGFFTWAGDSVETELIDGFKPDYLPGEQERLDQIAVAIKSASHAALVVDAPGHERYDALLDELDAIERKGAMRALPAAERAKFGVDIDFDSFGRFSIVRGIQRSVVDEEDDDEETFYGDDEDKADTPLRDKQPAVEKPAPLPTAEPIAKALRTVVNEALAGALHDVTARSVNLALVYAVATLGGSHGWNALDLRMHPRRDWKPAHPLLRAIAHENYDVALKRASEAPLADLTVAFCELIAASIDPARVDRIDASLDLVRAAAPFVGIEAALKQNLDTTLYFQAATRDAAIAAIRETEGEASALDAGKLGKKDLAARAALTAKDYDWLPPVLRNAIPAGVTPSPEPSDHFVDVNKMIAPDDRTTVEAMRDAIDADVAIVSESGTIAKFLEFACDRGPNAGRTKAQTLYHTYCNWAELRGWTPHPIQTFGAALADAGIEKQRLSEGVHYLGIALKSLGKEAAE